MARLKGSKDKKLRKRKKLSRFCRNGHDKESVGRTNQGNCKSCFSNSLRKQYEKDPEKYKKNALIWKQKNPEKYKKYIRTLNWKGFLNSNKTEFTLEDRNKLFNLQEGKCRICGVLESTLKRPLCVDHDHTTRIVRGLLCIPCNAGLGVVENIEFVLKAYKYLGNQLVI